MPARRGRDIHPPRPPRGMQLPVDLLVQEAPAVLVDEDRRSFLDKEIDRQLHTARWARRVNISASTGWHVDRLVPALERALDGWETRVQTGRLNAWLSGLVAATPPPARGGQQPKILFATQAGVRPPHFILFTSGF